MPTKLLENWIYTFFQPETSLMRRFDKYVKPVYLNRMVFLLTKYRILLK